MHLQHSRYAHLTNRDVSDAHQEKLDEDHIQYCGSSVPHTDNGKGHLSAAGILTADRQEATL